MRHRGSIIAALLLGTFISPPSVSAQDTPPVVVIEKPGGDTEIRWPPAEEVKVPRRLEWSAVLNTIDLVLELYAVKCCDPPPQFTLTPGRLLHLRNGMGGALHVLVKFGSNSGYVIPFAGNRDAYIMLDHPAIAMVELIGLKANYMYVLDFRVDGGNVPYDVSGDRIHDSNGHVLAIVTTDRAGNAKVTLDMVLQTEPRKNFDWMLYDVVVSELQPTR